MAASFNARLILAHSLRVAVVAAIAWLVHAEHGRFLARQTGVDLASLQILRVQRHLPEATVIAPTLLP